MGFNFFVWKDILKFQNGLYINDRDLLFLQPEVKFIRNTEDYEDTDNTDTDNEDFDYMVSAYHFDIDYAAKLGNMNILLFLYINDSFYTEDAICFAASNGHVKIVDWIYNNLPMKHTVLFSVLLTGAQYGNINIIDWGLEQCLEIDIKSINVLARCAYSCGHVNVVQHLDEKYGTIDWEHLHLGTLHYNTFFYLDSDGWSFDANTRYL
jgi:hypothetical protein